MAGTNTQYCTGAGMVSGDMKVKLALTAGLLILFGGAFYLLKKKGVAGVVGDVVSGTVISGSELIGIPRTNETECEAAIREGRTWDASFACPAGRFIGNVTGDIWDTITSAPGNAVKEVGSWVGIPDTNETECERAIREGRTWDASFACPAGTFLKSLF